MPSVIPGYEYDIFISYRQKDNKHDGWVTEFVDQLKGELEATFKEDVSVYFDINPHDGLLETHDVDASLKDKLRCLIFIPIISRTYCDPKSFAWEHEFKAFVEEASQDRFGLKVKLPGGNVASRVLPVRINDLDSGDIKLCESMLGGVLRSVDFIYKEPGVNGPLTPSDEEKKNLNSTRYRNQINKVALAIKEIISGMNNQPAEPESRQNEIFLIGEKPVIREKSIIVLPFENISPDPDQEYFSDGLTEEIISDLSQIRDLLVISRSSAMTFKGTRSTIKEIAGKVNARYVLEGSVRKAANKIRITAQLIDAANDSHIWAEKYTGTLDDVFDIQEKVSRAIADALKFKLSSEERKSFESKPIDIHINQCYLKAKYEIYQMTKESLDRAVKILQDGLNLFGENALLYATLGEAKSLYYDGGFVSDMAILDEAEKHAEKALLLEPDFAQGHKLAGLLERGRGNLIKGYRHMKNAYNSDPNDPSILVYTAHFTGIFIGRMSEAEQLYRKLVNIDPLTAMNYLFFGMNQAFQGHFGQAVEMLRKSYEIAPGFFIGKFWLPYALAANNQKDEAFELIDQFLELQEVPELFKGMIIFFKYALKGEREKALDTFNDEIKKYTWNDAEFSIIFSGYLALINENEQSLDYLEHLVSRGYINYPFSARIDPFLKNIRGEKRFKELMEKIKIEWENFQL